MTTPDFMECDTCRLKSGMPTLCRGCLHNRLTIATLRRDAHRELSAYFRGGFTTGLILGVILGCVLWLILGALL